MLLEPLNNRAITADGDTVRKHRLCYSLCNIVSSFIAYQNIGYITIHVALNQITKGL